MATRKVIGRLIAREIPDSPEWAIGDVDTCRRTFEGPYDDLLANIPAAGATLEGTGDNMLVQLGSTLKRTKAGMGRLTVPLMGLRSTSSVDPASALSVVEELDWQSLDKNLRTHPIWAAGATYPIDAAGWAQIDAWEDEPNAVLRSAYKYKNEGEDEVTLSDNGQVYAAKRLAGIENYTLFNPVVRKTSTYKAQPSPTAPGAIGAPDVSMTVPSGWSWMKTAARVVQQGDKSWQAIEEWTGAASWDSDLYPVIAGVAGRGPDPAPRRIALRSARAKKGHPVPVARVSRPVRTPASRVPRNKRPHAHP